MNCKYLKLNFLNQFNYLLPTSKIKTWNLLQVRLLLYDQQTFGILLNNLLHLIYCL